ncbi:MAG TPA: thioredoxin family protein [Bacillota bacterium]|nr:thioredoxin family protein [Bacillota bacterium]
MEIKVLGSGCPNCKRLEKNVREAAIALGIDANITKVTDYSEIVSYGVMRTPALVVDGEVLISGQVPSPERLQEYLKDAD